MFSIHDRLTPMNLAGKIPVDEINKEQIALIETGEGKFCLFDCKERLLYSDDPQELNFIKEQYGIVTNQTANNSLFNYCNIRGSASTRSQSPSTQSSILGNGNTNYRNIRGSASTRSLSPNNYSERSTVPYNPSALNYIPGNGNTNYRNIGASASTRSQSPNNYPERLTVDYNSTYPHAANYMPGNGNGNMPFGVNYRMPYRDYMGTNVSAQGYSQPSHSFDQRPHPNNYRMNRPSNFPNYQNGREVPYIPRRRPFRQRGFRPRRMR